MLLFRVSYDFSVKKMWSLITLWVMTILLFGYILISSLITGNTNEIEYVLVLPGIILIATIIKTSRWMKERRSSNEINGSRENE